MDKVPDEIDERFLVLTLLCNFPTRLAPEPFSVQPVLGKVGDNVVLSNVFSIGLPGLGVSSTDTVTRRVYGSRRICRDQGIDAGCRSVVQVYPSRSCRRSHITARQLAISEIGGNAA